MIARGPGPEMRLTSGQEGAMTRASHRRRRVQFGAPDKASEFATRATTSRRRRHLAASSRVTLLSGAVLEQQTGRPDSRHSAALKLACLTGGGGGGGVWSAAREAASPRDCEPHKPDREHSWTLFRPEIVHRPNDYNYHYYHKHNRNHQHQHPQPQHNQHDNNNNYYYYHHYHCYYSMLMIIVLIMSRIPASEAVDCFKCSSRNGSNPACEDPFHNLNSTRITTAILPDVQPNVIYHTPCYAGKKGKGGLFPASACIKLTGTFDTTGETLVVRHCALDSGTLTQDTELARMSHCGKFQFEGDLLRGCVLACPEDACNSGPPATSFPNSWLVFIIACVGAILLSRRVAVVAATTLTVSNLDLRDAEK